MRVTRAWIAAASGETDGNQEKRGLGSGVFFFEGGGGRTGTRDGKSARDVAGVTAPLGARVEDHELLTGQWLVVGRVVQRGAGGAGGGDDGVGLVEGAVAEGGGREAGEDVVLGAGAVEVGEDLFVGVAL